MNNSSFTQTDEFTRLNNLVDVLYKRCRGFLKRDVLMSVVNRLDLRKQMVIDVVDENIFNTQAKIKCKNYFVDGTLESVKVQWARNLIGSVEFGREVANVNGTVEDVVVSTPTKIISYPAIVLIEEQSLGSIDSISTRLLIYL